MVNFTEKILVEKFKAENNITGDQIVIYYYSKLSEDKKYFEVFICGDGKVLSPVDGEKETQFFHLLSGDIFTRK